MVPARRIKDLWSRPLPDLTGLLPGLAFGAAQSPPLPAGGQAGGCCMLPL